MSFTLSPNMNLPVPGVGTEPGPNYASDVNNSLTLVDQHDHSPGRGIQITPAGLNINSVLSFKNNSATNLNSLVMISQPSVSTLQALYVKPGSETVAINDLWFNDGAGNAVQLTSGGLVNATIASIPGESYAAGTFTWRQTPDGLPTTPANFDIGSITIRPNVALTNNGITLSPPSGIGSQYSLILPSLPAANSFVLLDASGNLTTSIPVANGIAAANIANNTITTNQISLTANITGTQLANQTITATQIANSTITDTQIASNTITQDKLAPVVSNANGTTASTSSTSFSNLLQVTLNTVGTDRPVTVCFPAGTLEISVNSTGAAPVMSTVNFRIINSNSVVLNSTSISHQVRDFNSVNTPLSIPASSLTCFDTTIIGGGSITYTLQASVDVTANTVASINNVTMKVFQ